MIHKMMKSPKKKKREKKEMKSRIWIVTKSNLLKSAHKMLL